MPSRSGDVITPKPERETEDEGSDLSEQSGSDEAASTSDGEDGAEKVYFWNMCDNEGFCLLKHLRLHGS